MLKTLLNTTEWRYTSEMFDIFCVGDNPLISELPLVKKINHESEIKSLTKMYWVIEPNIRVTDLNVFDFRPSEFEDAYEHVWKWDKNNFGGIKLLPRKSSQGIKEHDKVVCEKSYDVITDKDPSNYFIKHPYASHVWVVDPDYILPDRITWAPDNFEPDYIHVFHIAGQLEHKYSQKAGGVKLYPRKHNKKTERKYHGYLDVDINFPVIRTSEPNNYDITHESEYVWLVDDRLKIDTTELKWVPDVFQRDMVHNFHIPGQLEYEYPEDQGPISLVPTKVKNPDIVYQGELGVRYRVIQVTDPTDFTQRDHISDAYVWLVDERYNIDPSMLKFTPSVWDRDMVHNFHLKHQLDHIYPEKMGGVYLVPKNWKDAELKIKGVIDGVTYPVIYYHDAGQAFDLATQYKDEYDYVWIIDKHHKINPESLTWTPSIFDHNKIHNFRMPNQLQHKYPQEMGGIYLVPCESQDVEIKIHKTCPVEDEIYEVFKVPHDDLTEEMFTELAKKSQTEWFWVVDDEYDFHGKLRYIPHQAESDYIQAFKWGLEYRYLPSVTELWDKRAAGIFLAHKNFDWNKKKLHTQHVPIDYDIFYVDDINDTNNYERYSRQTRTKAFWLVDSEHFLPEGVNWVCPQSESAYINVFKVADQLEHKYPKGVVNVSDNRCGGIKLVPQDFDVTQSKFQGLIKTDNFKDFDKFTNLSQGRKYATTEWFWVIDPDVEPEPDFDWKFLPEPWDAGKTHVWQIKNPVTGLNYDYGGVSLHARNPIQGRDKYIKKIGSTRDHMDILYLDNDRDILEQIHNFTSKTYMYYIVDPGVNFNPDFKFDIFPTQWDANCVHVFKNAQGEYRNIRLVPKHFKVKSLEDLNNNTHENLKMHDIVATATGKWPVHKLESLDARDFHKIRNTVNTPWFYTIDPGTDVFDADWDFQPDVTDKDKVHIWQRLNPVTKQVHSYGGVRLWPTAHSADVTTDSIKFNKNLNMKYIRESKCQFSLMDILYLNDDTDILEQLNSYQSKSYMYYVVDPNVKVHPDFEFDYYPTQWDTECVHVFRNNTTGFRNVRLVPAGYEFESLDQITHNSFPILKEMDIVASIDTDWPVYELTTLDESEFLEIRSKVETSWFYTIDPSTVPTNDVWNFQPDVNDFDRVHVWDVQNPITKQSEPGGVRLWPTKHCENITTEKLRTNNMSNPKLLGRVKAEFKTMDVLYLTDDTDILEQLNSYQSKTYMYYVVDPNINLSKDFEFDVYPSQWDADCIHLFKNDEGEYRNVRLVPAGYEFESLDQITNNSYSELKELDVVASTSDAWPVFYLKSLDATEFHDIRANVDTSWFFTIVPGTEILDDHWDYLPDVNDHNKVHVWQRLNPSNNEVHSYGGVRLWPTKHCEEITTEALVFNNIPDIRYVRQAKSAYKTMDILYLSDQTDILEQLNNYQSDTYMYYVVDPHVKIHPEFKFDYYPTPWDKQVIHLFKNTDGKFKNVRLVPAGYEFESLDQITNNSYDNLKEMDITASINREWPVYELKDLTASEFHAIRSEVTEPWFFTIDPHTQPLSDIWDYEPDINDYDRVHTWQRLNPHTGQVHGYGGIRLWPTHHCDHITTDALVYNRIPRLRYVRLPRSQYKPYPVILLSYLEERAQTAFDALTSRSDNVLWVKDVKGIFNAHKEAAKLAGDHKMFWVVDADAELEPDFDFSYIPDVYDQETVHVWTTINPVTGSKYGYGGVKLFNTQQVAEASSWGLDFTTGLSSKFKSMPEVCATTKFNTTAYDTWRSAFREVVKLTMSSDPEAEYRITEWLNPLDDAEFGVDAKQGAEEAQTFAKQNANNQSELAKINDFEWLRKKFDEG